MVQYSPTFLYIKQHSITGKLYFGKTTKDPITYRGSGVYWMRHRKIHGNKNLETLWYCLFPDEEECTKFAIMCSEQWGIVKSEDWLNLILENGLNGTPKGFKLSMETRRKISLANLGKKLSDATKAKMSLSTKGRITSLEHRKKLSIAALNFSPEQRARQIASVKIKSDDTKQKMKIAALNRDPSHNKKIGDAHKGVPKSEHQKALISASLKSIPKVKCIHCETIGSPANMKRWHGDNCRAILLR